MEQNQLTLEQLEDIKAIKRLYPWANYIYRNNDYNKEPYYQLCITDEMPTLKEDSIQVCSLSKFCQLPNALKWVTFKNGIIDIDEVLNEEEV